MFPRRTSFAALFVVLASVCQAKPLTITENDRVILGVLAQETDSTHQFFAASYVKYLESGGARVVPVFVNQPHSYYVSLMKQINGVLFPGGSLSLLNSHYAHAADTILELAVELNQNGTYFPVWGTCLGFEKVIQHFVGNKKWMTECMVENVALAIDVDEQIVKQPNSTRMFQQPGSEYILPTLKNHRIAANYHRWCLTVDNYHKLGLDRLFTAISTSQYNGVQFVSVVEHKEYPIYGSSWHPEKNQFDFVVNEKKGNITHDRYAVLASQFFSNFLVNEARKNDHHFEHKQVEVNSLIYNYNKYLQYTSKDPNASFEEVFTFPLAIHTPLLKVRHDESDSE